METTDPTGYFYSVEYTFDADGRESKVIITDEYGIYIYNNVYDEEGNLIQEIVTDENSNETTIYEHTYDEQGNPLAIMVKEGDSVSIGTECTYDEKGQLIRKHHNYSDEFFVTWEYAYDANGNVINTHININGSSDETYTTEYKLVYIPFEYTEEEWDRIVFGLINW
jgi:YD repeat-containing protein